MRPVLYTTIVIVHALFKILRGER